MNAIAKLTVPLTLLALTACEDANLNSDPTPPPQVLFWNALASHCGKAYAGELVSDDAADADFAGAEMVMHVAECSDDQIAVPFHAKLGDDWDRSRTWVFTRLSVPHMSGEGATQLGLRLKHDHRHKDGEPDAVTMYGGDTAEEGTRRAQNFPVDAESIALFERDGLTASVTNVWRVEVNRAGSEGAIFAYQLQRTVEGGAPEERLFRVEFDLTREVEAPPPAWGHEEGYGFAAPSGG